MIAADFRRRERFGVVHVGVADDGQEVAIGLERCQAGWREVEAAADLRRRPQVLLEPEVGAAGAAVHHFHRDQPQLARTRRRSGGARREHGFEQRQRNGRAKAFQDGSTRQVLVRQDHRCVSSVGQAFNPRRHAESVPLRPNQCSVFVASARIRNAGLSTIPTTKDDSR
jgi:hypothetical protein